MNILFVEDDAMNRRVVRDMLMVAGASMDEAPDAETGLAMIDANDYDIVLMDLRMPGMDGLTAIRHIRARQDGKASVPVIVVTARDLSPEELLRLEGQAQRVLEKGMVSDDVLLRQVALAARATHAGARVVEST
jgi:CheY-like chemotaxis protein